ncbi:MAG: HIT family protein, partial [Candidatus Heimdallarchaeaceae archaeon]
KTIYEIPAEKMTFLEKLPEIAEKIKRITGATAINIWQNNGKDAGQLVPHVHVHIVPRYPNDGLFKFPVQRELEKEEAEKLVKKFKNE